MKELGILLRDSEWDIAIEESVYREATKIFIFRKTQVDGKDQLLQADGTIKLVGPADLDPEPTMRLTDGMIQGLFNALWDRGHRPKDRRYEKELDLMRNHLEDMRKIVGLTLNDAEPQGTTKP